MTADDDFLSRWSRRKQAAAETQKSQPANPELARGGQPVAGPDDGGEPAEPAFDITQLPPIDSITAISDVRDFLRAGVPADLTRAALRRAWSADPAIRDFIGLSENAWDFTDPNAIPGFGPLEATDDVRRMVEQIMSRIGDPLPQATETISEGCSQISESTEFSASNSTESRDERPGRRDSVASNTGLGGGEPVVSKVDRQVSIAAQREDRKASIEAKEEKLLRRTHGGALPH